MRVAPKLLAEVSPSFDPLDLVQVTLTGDRRALSTLLGSLLPKHHLVTIAAWRKGDEPSSLDELKRGAQDLEEQFSRFLESRRVYDPPFRLRDVGAGNDRRTIQKLAEVAHKFAIRGFLSSWKEAGYRVYAVQKTFVRGVGNAAS